MRDLRELKAWQKAHGFVLDAFRHTKAFPSDERFGLTTHLRKSATSIPSNIAEGCGRQSERKFARFLSIAAVSTSGTEYRLLLARDLVYLGDTPYIHLDQQVNEVKRMLNSLIQ
jgi:four helix bundle protein